MKKFIALIFMVMVVATPALAFDGECWSWECQRYEIRKDLFGQREADRMEREEFKNEIEDRIDELERRLNFERMNRDYNW